MISMFLYIFVMKTAKTKDDGIPLVCNEGLMLSRLQRQILN